MTPDTGVVALPARFFGAWERSELTTGGVAADDAGRAVWVQAGPIFVDVRGPGAFASDTCFAGTTKWSEPYLTWTHLIDRAGTADGVDRGHITFDGDDLIEQGTFIAGVERDYQERWTRLPGARAPMLAAESTHGLCVRVGDHAAAVVDQRSTGCPFIAAYWRWAGSGWNLELELGGEVAALPRPLEPGTELMDGWRWRSEPEVSA